jgi:hypothetical protein
MWRTLKIPLASVWKAPASLLFNELLGMKHHMIAGCPENTGTIGSDGRTACDLDGGHFAT